MTPGRDPGAGALRDLLAGDPDRVAASLLGTWIVSDLGGRVAVRATEVEAYGGVGEDPASHAHRRRTPRNAAMFGPVGHAYVYFTYGMHWCLNVVVHGPDHAGAVLIRAGEVVEGIETARARRPVARDDHDLARGPARLAVCLGVTGDVDGVDLLDPTSRIRVRWAPGGSGQQDPANAERLHREARSGPRTGVAGAGAATLWRFWLPDEPSVSPYRPAARARPR